MILTVNAIYHGFKVLEHAFVEEIHSDAYIMEHVQSGARLLYLGNNDDNKVFSIAFRTPPADDTGVPHIMEHSALCGSRKYPLKEPFVDLVKGSLNTFLNAMTYPDKTVYPVASRNDKDFHNLMDVYLDAVFYPLLYQNNYTLRQEGWHYNLDTPESELSYNGVVYNEMKGVYSSPDAYLEREAMKALFPDNCYRFESGGYPEAIPQLTQKQFEEFHKTYYSAENSFIYLYGDMDIDATLAYLDDEYLSAFTKTGKVNSEVKEQAPLLRTAEVEAFYPIDANESTKAKTYHELSIVTGKSTDFLTSTALRLLEAILLESESSPLRRALVEAGVGQNISGSYEGSLMQPIFAISASGSEPELRDKFISTIYKTLQDITINGIDKKLVEASLNALEFKLREADFGVYPKGLIYGLGILDSWIYGGNPIQCLYGYEVLRKLREGLENRYFEGLIENYLLDNTHKVIVTLKPQPGKEEADLAAEAAKMAKLKESMTQEELVQYAAECDELHRLQAEPDSEEARATIPLLQRSDIRRQVEVIPTEEELYNNNSLVFVPAVTNKIAYTTWNFDISSVPADKLKLCFLLTDVLGKFNTERYTYQEIATNSIMYTGGVSFNVRAISAAENADDYRVYFTMKGKALLENLSKMYDILEAVALGSKLDNLERFHELVSEIRTDWDNSFFNKGQNIVISRLYSYCAAGPRANEQDQFSYYQFLKALTDNFEEQGRVVLSELQQLIKLFFQKSSYILTYSCDPEDKELVKNTCLEFANKLNDAPIVQQPELLQASVINEGITTAGKVQYVAAGGSFAKHGHKFVGAMKVLETMLRYEYLWTKIRIQGGAYGATARFELNGLGVFASYRDPQLAKSLTAYQELPEWLEKLSLPERELDKYVIGTISGMDIPLTNTMKVDQANIMFIKKTSTDLRQRIRNEVLDVTNKDLNNLAQVVRDMLSDGYVCVVGGKQPIEANQDKFNKIINA